jgi:hypothetical protein
MKMNRSPVSKWFLVALMITAILGAIIYTSSAKQAEYRNEILALTAELSHHQRDAGEVRRLLSESRFHGLKLQEQSSEEWTVETPIQFGAKNWVLYIELRGSRVIALRIRTADNKNIRPKDAPPDMSFPSQLGN